MIKARTATRGTARWMVLTLVLLSFFASSSLHSFAQVAVGVSVRFGPPALPVYAQPLCPGAGYMWTPGYWGWGDDDGYYWVPGTWVTAPVGLLWTPGYWGWGGGFYAWHPGYWGPHIGFYGGINYGFGYTGVGFVGGEWRGGAFYYNRAVTNVSVTSVTNVYNHTVEVNENHTAFNGGEGGIAARPTPSEDAAEHEQHTPALAAQTQHEQMASQNRANFASENHGSPAVAATARAGDFSEHSAVAARAAGGEYHAPTMSPAEARGPSTGGASSGASNDGFRSFSSGSKTDAGSNVRPEGAANNSPSSNSASSQNRSASGSQAKPQNKQQPKNSYKPTAPARRSSPPPKPRGKGR
jgi:hypothetical protein